MPIFIGLPIRWFLRVLFIVFYGMCGLLHWRGYDVLNYIWDNHVYWSAVLIGITILTFFPWGLLAKFVGGEKPK